MKTLILLLALLIGFSDGTMGLFKGYPLVLLSNEKIIVNDGKNEVSFNIKDVLGFMYLPDNSVM